METPKKQIIKLYKFSFNFLFVNLVITPTTPDLNYIAKIKKCKVYL